jgi:hypothetical protein
LYNKSRLQTGMKNAAGHALNMTCCFLLLPPSSFSLPLLIPLPCQRDDLLCDLRACAILPSGFRRLPPARIRLFVPYSLTVRLG